jgi:superfamily II DNA or RNA helicase
VGFVQGKVWQVDGYDVVVAMVMTLAKRSGAYDETVMDAFGTVVVDEAHHMAAPVMSQAMRLFRARTVVALTATKDRPDGLTPLLHWSLGPEGFRVDRDSEGVRVSVALFRGAARELLNRAGQPLVAVMINNLATHAGRNRFLARRIVALRRRGRVLMVLSDRTKQLDLLRDLVVELGLAPEEVGVFKGGMRDADRVAALARPVVMCTYGMANEGVDKKEADTCVLATPKARVVQCIGRVQRPCETKQTPLVVDVADDVSVFVPLRWARQRLYSKEKYEVQVLEADAASEAQWYC